MKYTVGVLSVFVFLLVSTNLALPDELSDLKKQLEVLQQKVDAKKTGSPGQVSRKD
jgi:hypothetical protein